MSRERWNYKMLGHTMKHHADLQGVKNPLQSTVIDATEDMCMKVYPDNPTPQQTRKYHGFVQRAFSEVLLYFKGVTLHIDNIDLVQAIERTDLEMLVSDIKFPFPIIEFSPLSNIPINNGSSCYPAFFIMDMGAFDLKKEWNDFPSDVFDYNKIVQLAVQKDSGKGALTSIWEKNKSVGDNKKTLINILGNVSNDSRLLIESCFHLAIGTLLYIQSVQEQQILQPVTSNKEKKLRNNPSCISRKEKQRTHYKVLSVLDRHSSGGNPTSHAGSTKATHWRRGTMRVLKDERYKRNPDGSNKVTWIRPCIINPDGAKIEKHDRSL